MSAAPAGAAGVGGATRAATWTAARAVALRRLASARTSTLVFAAIFVLYAVAQVVGYRSGYPTLADRLQLSASLGHNTSVRLLLGKPFDLVTVGGYTGWRVGGFLSMVAAVHGLLTSVNAFRGEEESGRLELVLAGAPSRRVTFAATLGAVAASLALVWAATWIALVAIGLPVAASGFLAIVIEAAGVVFAGVGVLASQIAPTRRGAFMAGGAAVAVSFFVRVWADVGDHDWLRWATPLGWAEQARAFTGAQPSVLLLSAATALVTTLAARRIAAGRDVGAGLVAVRDRARPRYRMLGSVLGQTLRDQLAVLGVWALGIGAFAFMLGTLAGTIASAIPSSMRARFTRIIGGGLTPERFVSFEFVMFVLAISLLLCTQLASARREESEQRLETLLAAPLTRTGWLTARLTIALGAAIALALLAGLGVWSGAAATATSLALGASLEAGINCLPTAVLFLGIGMLGFGLAPRASTAIAYGAVAAAFVWQLVGAAFRAPQWTLDLSPFRHLGMVPVHPFPFTAALTMAAIGATGIAVGAWCFTRRDVIPA